MMIIGNKGYKYRLKPTKEQMEYISRCFGCARKVYNLYVDLLYTKLDEQSYEKGYIGGIKFPTPASFKIEYPYLKTPIRFICHRDIPVVYNMIVPQKVTLDDRIAYSIMF